MICPKCQKEHEPTFREGESCPSCGTPMHFTSSTELFIYLCRKYGRDVMNDGERMYALIQDHAPEKINKIQKLKILTESGVLQRINLAAYNGEVAGRHACRDAIAQLASEYALPQEEAEQLLAAPVEYFRQDCGMELLYEPIPCPPPPPPPSNPEYSRNCSKALGLILGFPLLFGPFGGLKCMEGNWRKAFIYLACMLISGIECEIFPWMSILGVAIIVLAFVDWIRLFSYPRRYNPEEQAILRKNKRRKK